MARMLQALKNLEARGRAGAPSTAAAPVSEPTAELRAPQGSEIPVVPALPALASSAEVPFAATQVVTTIEFAATQLASLNVAAVDSFPPSGAAMKPPADAASLEVIIAESLRRRAEDDSENGASLKRSEAINEVGVPLTERAEYMRAAVPPVERAEYTAGRPMSAVERTAARTLNNPLQARPIVDLVDRLEAETKQTGSQTVLLVSLGSGQGTTEAIVLTGTLLGERRRREVLLVDADLKRRGLTTALECLGKEGFADALVTDCMPTSFVEALATRNVRLLPAGRGGDLDSKQAEPRLEAALKSLSEAYGLVLLDGGQAGSELTAALARQADVTYLVVELGVVEAAEAQKALRDLRAAGGRVLGCIAV